MHTVSLEPKCDFVVRSCDPNEPWKTAKTELFHPASREPEETYGNRCPDQADGKAPTLLAGFRAPGA